MTPSRPKFDAPPLVETALSVQFSSLPLYSTAHAGWFWKVYLEKLAEPSLKWSKAVDAPRIEDHFERFGAEDVWNPLFAMKFSATAQSNRTQFIRSDGERMIQVQDSRLILNWQKKSGPYPTYETMLPEFRTLIRAFEAFAVEANFGTPQYNQWEVAYVDHIKKGGLWHSARDFSRIFSGLSLPPVDSSLLSSPDETMSADWRFPLAGQRGRIYIACRQLRLPPNNEEVLSVSFVARGRVTSSETWEEGFNIGHNVLNDTFIAMTSVEAQKQWKKRP
jgi:uncharacterized protein (TIGR04255 family)